MINGVIVIKFEIIDGEKKVELEFLEETKLKELIKKAGIDFEFQCGGKGTCGKCLIFAKGDLEKPSQLETTFLKRTKLGENEIPSGYQLRGACFAVAKGDVQAVTVSKPKGDQILSSGKTFEPKVGAENSGALGFAVDVGTTTISVSLYGLGTGKRLAQVAEMNHQRAFGSDVLSRINYSNENGYQKVTDTLIKQLTAMFKEALQKKEAALVAEVVITGNTTMLHFLMSLDPQGLGVYPFETKSLFGEYYSANQLFDIFGDECRLYIPRCIDAYVGGDITCGILASQLVENSQNNLLVDVGTNGEMVLFSGGKLYSCSTAAGPAFEGAEIAMGMTASGGAINTVKIQDDKVIHTTIGEQKAIGICGSGLIEAISEMLKAGIISETGELLGEDHGFLDKVATVEENKVFYISEEVYISQSDIREVQLAKSAIAAGVDTLINEVGIVSEKVDNLFIAGGFGSFIDINAACNIGLFPKALLTKASSLGNTAELGAAIMLFDDEKKKLAEELAGETTAISLSANAYFMDSYMDNMMFDQL